MTDVLTATAHSLFGSIPERKRFWDRNKKKFHKGKPAAAVSKINVALVLIELDLIAINLDIHLLTIRL